MPLGEVVPEVEDSWNVSSSNYSTVGKKKGSAKKKKGKSRRRRRSRRRVGGGECGIEPVR